MFPFFWVMSGIYSSAAKPTQQSYKIKIEVIVGNFYTMGAWWSSTLAGLLFGAYHGYQATFY